MVIKSARAQEANEPTAIQFNLDVTRWLLGQSTPWLLEMRKEQPHMLQDSCSKDKKRSFE